MYKIASRNLQRRNRVAAPLPTGGYIGETAPIDQDFIPSADNMSLEECEAERRQLLTELAKAQNQLIASKAAGDSVAVEGLGHRIQSYCSRLGLIRKRLHSLQSEDAKQALFDAMNEIVPAPMLETIRARQQELLAQRAADALKARAAQVPA